MCQKNSRNLEKFCEQNMACGHPWGSDARTTRTLRVPVRPFMAVTRCIASQAVFG